MRPPLARSVFALGLAVVLMHTPLRAQAAPLDTAIETELRHIVLGQIEAGRLPGAVVIAGTAHEVQYREAFGLRMTEPHEEAMTVDTVFDLASLTKVIATTTAVLQLSEAGRIDLDAPVMRYWPQFAANGKETVTVRQLLAHTSGLQADLAARPARGGRAGVLRAIAQQRLQAAPGERVIYSDLNFAALGELVERITGEQLDEYCRAHIFGPLRMHDTGFLPDARHAARSAATTAGRAGMRQGNVHDPLASWMQGVAGNAGLFSTAGDLARFAQMLLDGGAAPAAPDAPAVRVLSPASIEALTAPASPLATPPWRSLGWALASPLTANRDRLPPIGMIEHTGYTGTGIWIDFVTRRFVVILTNRVHPDDSGDARPLRAQIIAAMASLAPPIGAAGIAGALPGATAALASVSRLPVATGPVRSGLDVLEDQQFAPLAGLRIGLVTNRTGFDATGTRTVDVLAHAPRVTLVALFSPEHGLNGDVDEQVSDSRDAATGLIVHSLYGSTQRFPPDALEDIDALVYDIQDAGARFFTYETTLGYALEAAAARGIPLFVLDRPDPLGADRFGGPVLDSGHESFTGYYPLPLEPGMTVGELAALFNRERHIGADLRVIPMTGYRRSMRFADTGLGFVPLSPNLRTLAQLDLYPEVAMLEGANLSVGRGTAAPFELIGAPWIDGERLAAGLNALDTGVRFAAADFVPTESSWHGRLCHGVQIVPGPHAPAPHAGRLGLALAATLRALYPMHFDVAATRDAIGSRAVWQALRDGAGLDQLDALAVEESQRFAPLRDKYLRY
ncbi:Putative D-alanyl-D-alanine carboxypeptidase [Paraburkholderia phenoliruptrix]|uniref:D-alanyl-D-alanine carboxypeptidase n=1 Tax=Paraburkholderia phenoliruptrix TaxID=252970 RepID=A0A6J5A6R8_9BURK|nr:serine hydrolase [Paraburkholderia phenoliruptrix]CAB3656251.1 Putative D-alanyl-D-alanine carboxypeptidase [Paraburkholderia phenoliruptrix]